MAARIASVRVALIHPSTPFHEDRPTLGGIDEAVVELEGEVEGLREELDLYQRPINPSWYPHFQNETLPAGPGSGTGRKRRVQSIEDTLAGLEARLARLRRCRENA